jgi:N-acetylmuramoyl-L-alanine amidase
MWLVFVVLVGCRGVGREVVRHGDEIMIAGRLFHTGAPVVLWFDPGGYDAYRVERRFVPANEASWEATIAKGNGPTTPNRYGQRRVEGSEVGERVRNGGWDLDTLRTVVDQLVIHYDACGTSRQCFKVLHDVRGLSVHFMLDLDGTIYQTLDVKERAWHAGIANDRSVGVEIANIGAYTAGEDEALPAPLPEWYARDEQGWRVTLPAWMGDGGLRTAGFVARPARGPVAGEVHGKSLVMFDLTEAQYESLTRLVAALCEVLPRIRCDAPRDSEGHVLRRSLSDEELRSYSGLLGHYHVTPGKVDPGPAFDWERVLSGARRRIR